MTMRKINYRLYPSAKKEAALFHILRLQKDLYNAALQERIECYKKTGKGLSYNDQQKSLTQIRAESLEYKNIPIYISRMTLQRLHKAFNAFFKRVKRGQTPGFPRFKSIKRFTSFEMCAGSGWTFNFGEKSNKHGTLFIRGVGHIKARGKARTTGVVKTSQVVHKYGQWYLSVSVDCEPERETQSTKACGLDWGVNHLLTLTEEDGTYRQVDNPRYYQTAKKELVKLSQSISSKKRGSNRWKKSCKKLSDARSKIARKRDCDYHQLSHDIAKEYALVATEELAIKNMTKSAKGTVEKPGKKVKQKSGLNREILDTAPRKLLNMVHYKVEETDGHYEEVETKKVKPSQRCPDCLAVVKKSLDERQHKCPCGLSMPRDSASGLVMVRSVLGTLYNRLETSRDGSSVKPLPCA